MLKIEKGWVYIVAFSSKGHIAAGSDEGSITIWDSSLGRELYRLESHISRLRALAFSPDARYLAAASLRGLRIWDFNSQPEKSYDIEHPDGYIWSVSFSSDGRLLASGSNDNKIRIWDSWRDVNSDKSPLILSGHTDEVNSLAFSPEKRPGYLASGSDDGTTKIWAFDKEEPQCILTLVSGGPVDSISFSPDGLRLAFAVNSNTIEIWDVTVGDKLETMRATNDSSITSVAFSPTGASIASTSRDCRVHLWYTTNKNATKEACTQLPTIKEPVSELTVAPNGQTIATGHEDGEVILWNMNDEDVVPTQMPFPHSRRVYCLAFSPDGLSLASGSSDCGVRIYDVATRVKLADFVDHDDYVRSVAWSPEGKYLASGSDDRSVCIYQVDDQTKGWKKAQVVIHGEEYGDYVRAVAFSPNEAKLYLAAGGDNGKVVVWRQAEDKWVPHYAIDAHPDYVRSIVFTPDGGRIVSVGDDSTLRIWDFETKNSVGETIKTRVAHPRMRFEKGWETSGYVITGIGAQSIDPSIKTLPDWCPYGYEEAEEEDGERWITRSGKRVIFIPRIFSPNATYFMGNKVIMGMRTGSVMVFRFSEKEPSRVH
jgi:WD40 repeat protein